MADPALLQRLAMLLQGVGGHAFGSHRPPNPPLAQAPPPVTSSDFINTGAQNYPGAIVNMAPGTGAGATPAPAMPVAKPAPITQGPPPIATAPPVPPSIPPGDQPGPVPPRPPPTNIGAAPGMTPDAMGMMPQPQTNADLLDQMQFARQGS